MYNMSAKNTKSTTVRIDQKTKDNLENLDFVKKDTFDSIINKLIDFYDKNKKKVSKK
jgi:hypothetical protein